jgi:hypothetical protein
MIATAILIGAWIIATNLNPAMEYSDGLKVIMLAVIILDFISYVKEIDKK